MSKAQRRAYQTLLPQFGVPTGAALLDFDTLFGRVAPKFRRDRFWHGRNDGPVAARHPENDYLGIEVHTPGVGSLLKPSRSAISPTCASSSMMRSKVLSEMIPPAALSGVHCFPDLAEEAPSQAPPAAACVR